MGIPNTTLKGSGRDNQEQNQEPQQEQDTTTPQVDESVDEAIEIQQELLNDFTKYADEIKKLLVAFENSTFVKRLKAASRQQIDIAADLNKLDTFGLAKGATDNQVDRERLASLEDTALKNVSTIMQDMSAYTNRRPNENYLRVLSEMENSSLSKQMSELIKSINRNFIGQSTIEAEYWADTLDRWAEQLVGPLPSPPPPSDGGMDELPNLPPGLIIRVLRVINREIQLREETREVEQARKALNDDTYYQRSETLSDTQYDLAEETREIASEIRLLPEANTRFIQEELAKIAKAAVVMDEAESILARPETGTEAIATITEAIELLLKVKRKPNTPASGGGGGGNTPGGGGNAKGLASILTALRLKGMGDDSGTAFIEKRSPKQTIGKTGRVLPEEFRQGLDAYFNVLEGRQ